MHTHNARARRRTLVGTAVGYDELNREAEAVPRGAEGLLALDHFQVIGLG
jgi:hypothetical protein